MGLPALERLISVQQKRRRRCHRRRIQAPDGSAHFFVKRGCLSQQQDYDDSEGGKRVEYSGPDLPEDIWLHIYSLVPMQDAARAACVSRSFLHYWRCYPNIKFRYSIVGLDRDVCGKEETASEYVSKINQVLTKHYGGLKSIKLDFTGQRSSDCCFLDSWLQVAFTRGIEKLILMLSSDETTYSFPCSLLSGQCGNSIRYLHLAGCFLRPVVRLSCFRSLTNLYLYVVSINEDELGVLLSSCSAMEQFGFGHNNEITCLKIPCMLQRLSNLRVVGCDRLHAIESKAPNISSLCFVGDRVLLSLGEWFQLKKLTLFYSIALEDACDTLLSAMPNLESLQIISLLKTSTRIMRHQFLCLKYLKVAVNGSTDPHINVHISLVPFLAACPCLETFVLDTPAPMEHESIFRDPSHLRRMPGHRHAKLKSVSIMGFSSAKSLIELMVHIIENSGSLESLTLDTVGFVFRCSESDIDKCFTMRESTRSRMEVPQALLAIQKYIQCKIPSTVKLDVLDPCV